MSNHAATSLEKIVNPNLALAALNTVEPYGDFIALVKMAKPRQHPPTCLKSARLYAPNLWKALIPCDQIDDLVADTNVISVELRERIA
jgi:hypothetical protein